MILKVTLHDNDFARPLERACQDLLHNFVHNDAMRIAEIEADPEGIRRTLVVGTFGHNVTLLARKYMMHYYRLARLMNQSVPESVQQFVAARTADTLDYIEHKLSVEIIETMEHEPEWSNGEVVYVDFAAKTVENR